ncbi:MAG: general secretion pathway protein GspL [Rubrivivax sp.]|nr:general secretion pathway protein GspL [Rubrivivax sp.]MCL4695970.1 general secretion pathway protein GspL [Burkholderiaceae bacterium]
MSVLAICLAPRERIAAQTGGEAGAGVRVPDDFAFVFSADGTVVSQTGRTAASLLPKADRVIVVLADADVSWHRIKVPKAPPAKLRAALLGMLEETLLDDEGAVHLVLAPGGQAGRTGWVAVTHKPWLAAVLGALEAAGTDVEKVVPASAPVAQPMGHFFVDEDGDGNQGSIFLVFARKDGVNCVNLDGALAKSLVVGAGELARWTATPAAAPHAERWLGTRVAVLTEAERAMLACRGATNLRQYDLASRHRGMRALRDAGRRFMLPEWRAVRWGVAGLVAMQLVGLNAYAWHQERQLERKRAAMNETLRAAFPGVRTVLDAPLQMQRETDRARALAGRAGEADFESLLGAAAAAWPDGAGPAPTVRYEPGRLTLAAPGWGEAQVRQLRDRLAAAGLGAEFAEGRVVITRRSGRNER